MELNAYTNADMLALEIKELVRTTNYWKGKEHQARQYKLQNLAKVKAKTEQLKKMQKDGSDQALVERYLSVGEAVQE